MTATLWRWPNFSLAGIACRGTGQIKLHPAALDKLQALPDLPEDAGHGEAVQDLHEQGSPAFETAMPILSQLLKAEMAEREVRSIAYRMKAARFPAYKDLSGFDFAASEIREALVRQLHRCEFMDAAENVVLIGDPGTGKSHVATALGIQAIEHHRKRVRFFSTVELVNALEQEKAQGNAEKIAETLVKTNLVVLDALGYPHPP